MQVVNQTAAATPQTVAFGLLRIAKLLYIIIAAINFDFFKGEQ